MLALLLDPSFWSVGGIQPPRALMSFRPPFSFASNPQRIRQFSISAVQLLCFVHLFNSHVAELRIVCYPFSLLRLCWLKLILLSQDSWPVHGSDLVGVNQCSFSGVLDKHLPKFATAQGRRHHHCGQPSHQTARLQAHHSHRRSIDFQPDSRLALVGQDTSVSAVGGASLDSRAERPRLACW